MTDWKIFIAVLSIAFHLSEAGSPCPPSDVIHPCHCSSTEDEKTTMICSGLQTSSQLKKAADSIKNMIIDSFILIGNSKSTKKEIPDMDVNGTNSVAGDYTSEARLPKEWLKFLRVKEIIIHNISLAGCFFCEDPFLGQSNYLTNLVVTHASLQGHLCTTCNTKNLHAATKELLKIPKLKSLDLSYNHIEIINGKGFPIMKELIKIDLSNNEITKIYDNAFNNTPSLAELNLSRNRLTSISRKMFRSDILTLKFLDLSWNSIEHIPEDMFKNFTFLKGVKFTNNLLETLPVKTWTGVPVLIESINVNGNFIVCNCSLSWISNQLPRYVKFSGQCVDNNNQKFREIKLALTTMRDCR